MDLAGTGGSPYTIEPSTIEILVVEDSPTQALELQFALERRGFKVDTAPNGRAAAEKLSRLIPTIVISDVVMPEMDGYELCRHMKNSRILRDVPVILLTALTDPREIIRGLESGADNFITKPFREDILVARIQYILVNKALRKNSSSKDGIEIFFAGQVHRLQAASTQVFDLLFSSYEAAINHFRELQEANDQLRTAYEQIETQAAKLKELALVDELTGLNNRRGFLTLAEHQLKIAERVNAILMLLFMDLDNFKHINDNLGHAEGDKVLVAAADILRATFRQSDIVGRLGGDEFVVLITDENDTSEEFIKARLERSLHEFNSEDGRNYKLSISIGMAFRRPDSPCSLKELMDRADSLMYQDKQRKRIQR
jgi:diguanylate cyclase (GGDEF)-like protein